jgi:hypothetical protein
MSNENKTNTIKLLSGSSIIPTETGIMYFLAFEGVFCLGWLIAMFFGYSFGIEKPVNYIKILCTPFFLYIIFKGFRSSGYSLRCFAGLTLPLILFWAIVYWHRYFEIWHFAKHPIIWSILTPVTFLVMLAFSIPVKRENINRALWYFTIPLFIVSILCLLACYKGLLQGASARSPDYYQDWKNLVDSLWNGVWGGLAYYPGLYGGFLGLLSLWGLYTKKFRIEIGVSGYLLGSIFVYFGSYKTIFGSWILVHLLILFISVCWKKWSSLWIIPFILLVNTVLLFHIGTIDDTGIGKRLLNFKKIISKLNVEKINKQIISKNETKNETKNEPVKTQQKQSEITKQGDSNNNVPNGTVINYLSAPKDIKIATNNQYLRLAQIYSSEDPRFTLYMLGIRQILTHPIIGYGSSFMIVKIDNEYVKCDIHSNILSAFLATGILGGLLYLAVILRGFYDSIIVFRRYPDYGWLAVIFIFSFVANIFAYGFMEIWVWLPLVALRAAVKSSLNEPNIVINTDKISDSNTIS